MFQKTVPVNLIGLLTSVKVQLRLVIKIGFHQTLKIGFPVLVVTTCLMISLPKIIGQTRSLTTPNQSFQNFQVNFNKFIENDVTSANNQLFLDNENKQKAYVLARLINQYRVDNGLDEIPISPSLTYVAEYHVYDLEVNSPTGGICNLHSWSNNGKWSPCCYTGDHAQANCMWNKPKELTNGLYNGSGFEIAAMSGNGITANQALELWKGSPGHNDVILNRGNWADQKFKAMGVGISNYYAVVWFGKQSDPAN